MKTVTIKNYKQGLCSFLDEKEIQWVNAGKDVIEILIEDDEALFNLAFEFGCFYSNENNY